MARPIQSGMKRKKKSTWMWLFLATPIVAPVNTVAMSK